MRPRLRSATPMLFLAFAVACASSPTEVQTLVEAPRLPEGKLPEGVRPTSYRLSLEVVPERDRFSGSAMITVELDRASNLIWMHGERLEVTSIYATHATTRVEASWAQLRRDAAQRIRFRCRSCVAPRVPRVRESP